MTIKFRERTFWGFFGLSATGLALAAAMLWRLGPENLERVRAAGLDGADPVAFYTMVAAAGACGIYGAIVSGLVALRSGKTVSIEIFFFALWAFGQSFELARIGSVALVSVGAGSGYFEVATRLALFGRYVGAIAIFSGSLFSVGLKQDRGMPVLMASLMAGLLFASTHPLNSIGPGRYFLADIGAATLALAFEAVVIVMALVNYIIAWRSGKDKAYFLAGFGLAMSVGASMTLRTTASPWLAAAGAVILAAGTWIYIKSLRDYYLWR